MNETQVIKYQCPTCGELHDHDHQAEDCCTPEAEEVTMWECDCGELFDKKEHAHLCCWDGETDLEPYQPTPQELEAAGQMRLSI